jgi:hypothetical protein
MILIIGDNKFQNPNISKSKVNPKNKSREIIISNVKKVNKSKTGSIGNLDLLCSIWILDMGFPRELTKISRRRFDA